MRGSVCSSLCSNSLFAVLFEQMFGWLFGGGGGAISSACPACFAARFAGRPPRAADLRHGSAASFQLLVDVTFGGLREQRMDPAVPEP